MKRLFIIFFTIFCLSSFGQNGYVASSYKSWPIASNLTIIGSFNPDSILVASYTYSDIDSDLQGQSDTLWYRSIDSTGTEKTLIAETDSLLVDDSLAGYWVGYGVIPKALTGRQIGKEVFVSDYMLPDIFVGNWYLEQERDNYYINQVGDQEREVLTENSVAGIIQPGYAIQYDGTKSQYSRTAGNEPNNFKLYTNSITLFFRIKMDAAPAGNSFIIGNPPGITNGFYWIYIATSGKITAVVRHTVSTNITSTSDICDGEWHDIFILINKVGNFSLYVDNILQSGFTDISAISFSDISIPLYIGGFVNYYSGVKQLRDIKLWSSAITSESDRLVIHNGEYVTGCTSWWTCEENKSSSVIATKDAVGTNHLSNSGFDATSLISGTWPSLFNKYGYSNLIYTSDDLFSSDGVFDTPTEWTYTATKWDLASGVAWYKSVDANTPYLLTKRTMAFEVNDLLKLTFDVTEGPATFYVCKQTTGTILDSNTYSAGHHVIFFNPATSGTGIGIRGAYPKPAFKIDNFFVSKYDSLTITPKINSANPTTDIYDRDLIFKGQAKYNLIKVDANTVQLPDSIGELINACDGILVNDWYDADGVGNEIDIDNIEPYQTGKQYWNGEQLLIVRDGETVSPALDELIKKKLMLNDDLIYAVDVGIGDTTGTTTQIYAISQAILDDDPVSTLQLFTPIQPDLNPTKNYIALEWADFFTTDPTYIIPLNNKYGFSNTFGVQIVPASDDYLNENKYDRSKLRMIEQSGNWRGNHAFDHISYISSLPTYDGRTIPSNDDLRVERVDGTNELGHDVDATIDTSIVSSVRQSWLLLSNELGAKAWKDLTDADCIAFRKSMGIFGMPVDGQNGQKVLEALDFLSNRYCGTIGLSIYDDYTTRTPNTADGNEPSVLNPIIGGIFQGASTTQNQEIWERVIEIFNAYVIEFDGKINPIYFWGTPGGTSDGLFYNIESPPDIYGRYTDREHMNIACGATQYQSSITGLSRSYIEVLQNYGYICSMATQGDGYATKTYDGITRLESQRIFKKNGLKKIDNVGDGYTGALRIWDNTIPEIDIDILLASEDLVQTLYTYTDTAIRYTAVNGNYSRILDAISKYNAWGLTPDFIADSYTDQTGCASFTLVLETLYQYCLRAGITVISHEEACLMGRDSLLPDGYNYFPNSAMNTTVKTITESLNAPVYPDGWDGGVVLSEDTGDGTTNILHKNTDGTIFIRQYAIKPSTLNLSFKAKGVGTLKIRKILNKDTFNTTSGAVFTEINSITINSPDSYTTYTDIVSLPDAAIEVYDTPATPQEEVYQNYMKGYGDKICGIQIELIVTGGNYVKFGNCSLTE